MLAVILAYDQLLFRPLVAWSTKFRFETTAGATAADPWLLRLMRRTRLLSRLGDAVGRAASALGGLRCRPVASQQPCGSLPSRLVDAAWFVVLVAVLAWAVTQIVGFIAADLSWRDLWQALGLGLLTLLASSVLMVLAACSGCRSASGSGCGRSGRGERSRSHSSSPRFPANLLFPPVVLFIVSFQA